MASANEDRELELVQKAQMRILAVSSNEKKLQDTLNTYMCPLLLKAGSPSSAVRDEVIKFAGSLQTIIKPTSITLPVEGLIDQYKAQSSPIVRHVDMMFISLGIERMDDYERRKIVHKIANGISSSSQGGSSSPLLRVFLRVVPAIQIPSRGTKESSDLKDALGLSHGADAAWLATWLGKALLLKLPNMDAGAKPSPTELVAFLAPFNKALSPDELKFLSPQWQGNKWAPPYQELPSLRRHIAKLLASSAFSDRDKVVAAIYAASSHDSMVSEVGEDMLKRTSISFDDEDLAKDLFSAHGRMTAPYRTRILGLLSKSTVSTAMEAEIQKVVGMDLGHDCPEALKPASGLEQQKLHRALLGYLSFVALWGPTKGTFSVGNDLIDRIWSFFDITGWPVPQADLTGRDVTASSDADLRGLAYEALGLLIKATNLSSQRAYELADRLLKSLSEDPTSDIVFHIDAALSGLIRHFKPSAGSTTHLAKLLYNYLILPEEAKDSTASGPVRSVRFTVVKWANQCLAFTDWRARWIDILAVSGRQQESHDVVEEGKKGLDPWTYRVHEISDIPDWRQLLTSLFFQRIGTELDETAQSSLPTVDPADLEVSWQNFQDGRTAGFPVALNFTKHMMYLQALPSFEMGPDWVNQMETTLKNDVATRSKIHHHLSTMSESSFAGLFLKTCFDGAVSHHAASMDPVIEASLRSLVDVAILCPARDTQFMAPQAWRLYPLLGSNNKQIRGLAAKAIGILTSQSSNEQSLSASMQSSTGRFAQVVQNVNARVAQWETAVGLDANAVEGNIQAFGSIYSHAVFNGIDPEPPASLPASLLLNKGQNSTLQDAAIDAFAQLWTSQLPIAVPKDASDFTPRMAIEALKVKAEAGSEKAIFALGRLAMAFPDSSTTTSENSRDGLIDPESSDNQVDEILKTLFGLARKKETELHFAVGEAIAAATACLESDAVKLGLTVEETNAPWAASVQARGFRVKLVLDKLFQDCKDTAPFKLKSSGIWLFCLIQYCGGLSEVQSRLREAQVAFMRLLNARDELVQETASRGLVLIYEKGDEQLRDLLSQDLVSSLTDQSSNLKVEGDTELFEAGALPTGDGKSIRSYKDIVALANEVGDQSLVYKFMALANNAAMWSTRSAFGRFGLGNILADSNIDPKVYPPLFRYRFDPNRNAQASMENVWKALVKDQNAVIQKHFDAIMSDLLKTILGKEWRVREASCAAISDLIGGQPFDKYSGYYERIWTSALKVLDDVKGSVREAAMKLCMGLTNTIVRLLEDGNRSSAAQAMMNEAFRFLLSPSGLESSVKEVQAFSFQAIMDITKKGGQNLRPFISTIVPHLLDLHSTAEGEQLNYAYQKVASDTRDQIDKMRASFVNASPISEAVDNCLRQLDGESMKELAPKVEAIIKSAIGMQTKIACSRLLTDLVLRHRVDFEPLAGKFLRMMEKQSLDKNDEVSRAYATTSAYLMRVASDAAKQRFVKTFVDLYFESEEEIQRRRVSGVFLALSKSSPDEFVKMESKALPFAYLASHDTDKAVKKSFATVWDNHAGSSRTVARYVPEIISFVQRGLKAPRWALQHTCAFTIASMIHALVSASDSDGQISEANLRLIWPELDTALALKTFEKKETLLEAFPVFVDKGLVLWKNDSAIAAKQQKIAIREAKRNNAAYRVHAFKYLWKFAEVRDDLDLLDDIFTIVEPSLQEIVDEDRMEVDSDDKATETAAMGIEAVARGHNREKLRSSPQPVLSRIFELLQPFLESKDFFMIRRQVWYACVRDMMRTAAASSSTQPSGANSNLATKYLRSLDMDHVDNVLENQRKTRAEAIGAILKAQSSGVFGSPAGDGGFEEMILLVKQNLEKERSVDVQSQLRGILEETKS